MARFFNTAVIGWPYAVGILILTTIGCPRHGTLSGWRIAEGEYTLFLEADEGTRRGGSTTATMSLRSTADTRLPGSEGFGAPVGIEYMPLYGWTDADFTAVGAPMCPGGSAPSPTSRDPRGPGVVVLAPDSEWVLETRTTRPADAPILAIGTLINILDGQTRFDGCGIGLFVQSQDGSCLTGAWYKFGLAFDGRGRFRICRNAPERAGG